jgi:hypothetical protein
MRERTMRREERIQPTSISIPFLLRFPSCPSFFSSSLDLFLLCTRNVATIINNPVHTKNSSVCPGMLVILASAAPFVFFFFLVIRRMMTMGSGKKRDRESRKRKELTRLRQKIGHQLMKKARREPAAREDKMDIEGIRENDDCRTDLPPPDDRDC